MPALKQRIKQQAVIAAAGEGSRPLPFAPDRTFLMIQNTGANPGLVRLEQATGDEGSSFILAVGDFLGPFQIAETCPKEAVNFSSDDGTSFSVAEGITPGWSERNG